MSKLFEGYRIGGVALKNRMMVSPMCQYSAVDGVAQPWHRVNYGRYAMGGAGLVMVEVTAVNRQGMGTHGDLGLWNGVQQEALAEVAHTIDTLGAVPAIQIGHAGRKGSAQRPWHGGRALSDLDIAERGEAPWQLVGPSAIAMSSDRPAPAVLDGEGIAAIRQAFVETARRAVAAGFKAIEIHSAHGYLLHQFVSPLSNHRQDDYGGSPGNRWRLPLEIVREIKAILPSDGALLVRVSCSDGADGGNELPETIAYAAALKEAGADAIDCSSGGISGRASANRLARGLGFQIPFSAAIRREVGIPTIGVGLILDGPQAEAVLQVGDADVIAIGRAALYDPNWALHAQEALEGPGFAHWPPQHGWWLQRRAELLDSIAAS